MRVLMLTTSWPLCDGDWRGGFVMDLCRDLASSGIDVDVAVPAPAAACIPEGFDSALPIAGVTVHWLPRLIQFRSRAFHQSGLEANLRKRPWSALSMGPVLGAFAAECSLLATRADVIVSNWLLPMGAVGATVAGVTGRPHLVIAHSAPAGPAAIPPVSTVIRKVIESADSVACVSESVLESTAAIAGPELARKLKVIRLGIDLVPVVLHRPSSRPFEIAFSGRIVPIKGADILVRAAAGIPGCRLVIVGDGPGLQYLRLLSARLGVNADFVGELSRQDARKRIAMADVVVIPSRKGLLGRQEGLPRVLVEAWAAGVPVVASRSGGMTEVMDGQGGGILFDPGDVEGLRRILAGLASDPHRLAGLRAQAITRAAEFDAGVAAAAWAQWIRGACS